MHNYFNLNYLKRWHDIVGNTWNNYFLIFDQLFKFFVLFLFLFVFFFFLIFQNQSAAGNVIQLMQKEKSNVKFQVNSLFSLISLITLITVSNNISTKKLQVSMSACQEYRKRFKIVFVLLCLFPLLLYWGLFEEEYSEEVTAPSSGKKNRLSYQFRNI